MKEISAAQLEAWLKEGRELELIDIREDFEVQLGKVPEAKHIPMQQLMHEASRLDQRKEYVLICRSGNRSGMLGQFLEMQGFNMVNVVDGMLGWKGPIE